MRHDGLARPAGLAPSDIAEILGLLPADMTIHLIKEARQAVGRRQVFRVSVPGRTSLIVKSEPAVSEAEFAHVVENYQALSAALGETGANRIVPLLHCRDAGRVLVMEYVSGLTAFARLEAAELGLDDRTEVLRRCGAWLAQAHAATESEVMTFDGAALLRRTRRLARAVRNGKRDVVFAKRFLGLCALIHRLVHAAESGAQRLVRLHGDPQPRNST